ncbi:MAG TPA: baseplate J/gp47 family protein [Syntrophomonas sp.]|nr:baseplate J/gp47 family protein [Syntrophomonas sp.]
MFESQTYEVILARMLARVPATFDKREGSMIYDALAPAAAELAQAYINLDVALDEGFADTASLAYLIRRAAEQGVTQDKATYAVVHGVFNIDVDIGTRFSGSSLYYTVTEQISDCNYKLQCETVGAAGNGYIGTIIPVGYIKGLTSAEITEILTPGEDEEEVESLRSKYFEAISDPTQDGNIAQYKAWANDYTGIGRNRVFPLWNGANTVKVSILNASQRAASTALVSEFQEYLDPLDSPGLGNGVAPIGSIVTVATATEVNISVAVNLSLTDGYTEPTGVQDAIGGYLTSIAYVKSVVSYFSLAAAVQDCDSISSISSLQINTDTADIALGAEEIPVLYAFDYTVVTS